MKRAQREIYQILANEIAFPLCNFCKFDKSTGSICDGGGDMECSHPLGDRSWAFNKQIESAEELGDCWGFRPAYPIPFIADIVGAVLANGWQEASWWQNKKGIWKIAGRTGL